MVDDLDYPLRYAFTAGDALFVALDDTKVGSLPSEQMSWLDDVLDTPAEVKVVYGHVPLYPVAQGRETDIIGDDDLHDLLLAHGVDLFVAGHHHAYYPAYAGDLRVLTMGCLGSGSREYIGTSQLSDKSFVLFEVRSGAVAELEAWRGDAFDEVVPRNELPESIAWSGGTLIRDDL